MLYFKCIIINPIDKRRYEITEKDDTSIWISDGSGEGAEFSSKMFFDVIDEFYRTNF